MSTTDKRDSRASRLEAFFAKQTQTIITFRFPVVFLLVVLALLLAAQVRHLTIDTSNEGFLHPDDEILLNYNEFRDQFGRDDLLLIAIKSNEQGIYQLPFLKKLKQLHEQLAVEVPYLSEVTSLVNARSTLGQADALLVDDLLAKFPQNEQDLAALQARVTGHPTYTNTLVSEDHTFTTILLRSDTYSSQRDNDAAATDVTATENAIELMAELEMGFDEPASLALETGEAIPLPEAVEEKPRYLTDQENTDLVRHARDIVQRFNSPGFQVFLAGSPVVTHTVKQLMMADMKRFLRLAVLTIALCLFLMFRRFSGVILPILVVGMTLVTTLGVMASLGIAFKPPTMILPSFLLAVGVGASIHVLSLVYQYLRQEDDPIAAIVHAYGHSGFAIVMTSLTTAAGLASFATADVAPIADLGLFSAIGVLLSLVFTLFLLPALLAMMPLKPRAAEQQQETPFDRLIDRVVDLTTQHPKQIVMLAAIGILLACAGLPRLQFSHNVLNWLPESLPVRVATEQVDHHLRGSVVLEVVLDTGRENGLYDRASLLAMDQLVSELSQFEQGALFIGKVLSVATILKEIHQALNENQPAMYKIPEDARLIPQEFLLFENSGSDDLQDFVDSRFQQARISIKVPWQDALTYVPFIQEMEQRFQTAFAGLEQAGKPVGVRITGIMSLFARVLYASIYAAAQSYGIALLVISVMMILLIGHVRLGLIAMIPNLGPILMVMGIMGWFSIPLDMFTMLVASVAIGLAVDDTVHFIYNFKRYYLRSGQVRAAVHYTLHTAGRAMLTTSIVLSIGFFIFMFASMNNVINFGMLVGIAIILALLGDFLLAPALMALLADKMLKKR